MRARGVTIVLVTHFMDEAEHLCDRLAIIDHGTVVAAGRPGDLTTDTAGTRYLLHLPCHANPQTVQAAVHELPGVDTVHDGGIAVGGGPQVLTAVLVALAQHGITPTDIRTHTRSLEDVYLGIADSSTGQPASSSHRR